MANGDSSCPNPIPSSAPAWGRKPHHARSTQVPRRQALAGGALLPRDRAVKKKRRLHCSVAKGGRIKCGHKTHGERAQLSRHPCRDGHSPKAHSGGARCYMETTLVWARPTELLTRWQSAHPEGERSRKRSQRNKSPPSETRPEPRRPGLHTVASAPSERQWLRLKSVKLSAWPDSPGPEPPGLRTAAGSSFASGHG